MLKQIVQGYRPVLVGAFALDALIEIKHVLASFGFALSERQADAIFSLAVLAVAFVVQRYTGSKKYFDEQAATP